MNKKVWIGLFFGALISDLVCIQVQVQALRYVTKPLLALLLAGYFISSLRDNRYLVKWWVVAALGFSWMGDVFLLFEAKASLFFILGLSSFLLAHVCYSWFFNKVMTREGVGQRGWFSLFVIIYYAALMQLLGPSLGALKGPVYVYGAVICVMLWLALHLNKVYQRNAGLCMVLGALLFVLSDSILAINKFYQPFTGAGILVMLTYGLAQWLIVEGSIRWLQDRRAQQTGHITAVRSSALV